MSGVPAPHPLDPLAVDDVAGALIAFVNGTVMARGHAVRPDDDLEAAGVDSMALLKILLFVEKRFGFWIPDDDLTDANVKSARALAAYICGRRDHRHDRS